MQRFPDRPKMRQLSKVRVACCVPVCCRAPPTCVVCARQFDSIKRADYNFRGEQLDWQDKRMYVPRGNKNEFNERQDSSTHRLSVPPALSRTEFPVHSALISKVPWPAAFPLPSTWISCATRSLMCCVRRARRLDGTARPGPGETPTLRRRHTRPKAWPCCSLPATTRRANRRRHARPWCAAAPAVVAPAAGLGGSSGRGSGAWWWHGTAECAVVAPAAGVGWASGRGSGPWWRHASTAPARYRRPCSPLPCCVPGGTRGALPARGSRRQSRAAEVGGARRGVAAAAATAVWTRRARDVQAGARAQNHDLVARWLLRSSSLFCGDGTRARQRRGVAWRRRCVHGAQGQQREVSCWLSVVCLVPWTEMSRLCIIYKLHPRRRSRCATAAGPPWARIAARQHIPSRS